MAPKVIINYERCKLISARMASLHFRDSFFQRPFLTFSSNKETKLRVFLFVSAICHQTHTLINREKKFKGWDYLEDVFANLGEKQSELLDVEFLAKLSPEELGEKLRPLFSPDGNPDNCTLDRLKERAKMIIQIADKLIEKYDGKIERLLEKSDGYLGGEDGLYNLLKDFEAFTDPHFKKSTVFIELISDAKLFDIKDPDSIRPTMDYHMQRLLLRTGCLEVKDRELSEALKNKKPMASDEEVRQASIEAVKIMGKAAKKNFFEMNFMLWSIGRSCCKEKTLCFDKECNKNPCTFFKIVDIPNHDVCVFDGACAGSADENYRKYWQPMIDTEYY